MRASNAAVRTADVDIAALNEVFDGLSQVPKHLPCKLFYDEEGAALFERICTLPEYYPTRTELGILRAHGAEMAAWIGERARIVEYGSGSGDKTRLLLSQLSRPSEYVPVDISAEQLYAFARSLAFELPWIHVNPLNTDYTRDLTLPPAEEPSARTIVFFPGSTIGNFEPDDAVDFLREAAKQCGPTGGLLIGVDLRKDRATLERAYNDEAGVTAAFNLNILTHINRLCLADFNVTAFRHHALYDETLGRIEMHLLSRREQRVRLGIGTQYEAQIAFARDENIITEYSYKYDIAGFHAVARDAGFESHAVWTDADNRFSVQAFNVL